MAQDGADNLPIFCICDKFKMGRSRKTQTRKTSSGCAVKLKVGSVLCDTSKEEWLLGKSIGAGGFGDIYLVSKDLSRPVPADAPHVAKVELLSNGPLFVEMNFYLRVGKKDKIENWKNLHKLSHLGMPHYIGFGSHSANNDRYRFLILDRFGSDLGSLFTNYGRRFPLKTVLTIGLQILDILEYIHYHGYIHADIKGSNLLLGMGESGQNKVYLLDYGLACLYVDRFGCHKEYVQDMRRAHDGTLEYTSRDAHVGAHSRRGDLEVLGYNFVQWLCGVLPWESDLNDPDCVAAAKNLYMKNINHFMEKCFPRGGAPGVIVQYLRYVAALKFTDKPDYEKLRSMLRQGLRAAGLTDDGVLNLGAVSVKKSAKKRGRGSDTENRRRSRISPRNATRSTRKPCVAVEVCERRTRLRQMTSRNVSPCGDKFDWVKVLQSHPERDAKPVKRPTCKARRVIKRTAEDVDSELLKLPENALENPTPAIEEVLRKRNCCINRVPAARRGRVDSHRNSPPPCESSAFTPAMEEVLRRRIQTGSGNYEPTKTAMSTRAERMRIRAQNQIENAQNKIEETTKEAEDSNLVKRSTRLRKRAQTQCTEFTSEPPARLVVRPSPRRAVASPDSSPTVISPSSVRVTRKRKKTNYSEDSDGSESYNSDKSLKSDSSPSAFKPVVSRMTRQQQRCDPSLWSPIKALQWRPPTPPRKPLVTHSGVKRRMSDDDDPSVFFDIQPSPPSRITRHSKTLKRLPTQPKYVPKALRGGKRLCRRDVSPSDVDFVPRLRSGKDTSEQFRIFHGRPGSTASGSVRSLAAGLNVGLKKGLRHFRSYDSI